MELWRKDCGWDGLGQLLDDWLSEAAAGIAHAVVSASAVYDFEAAVIEGSFPPFVRERLVTCVAEALAGMDTRGLVPVAVRAGSIGRDAREIGSASLPFFARYLTDRRVLYSERA